MPNALTVARLASLPVLVAILWRAEGPTAPWAALLFGVVGATDLLDGWLARRLRAESRFGRIADPLADRLLVLVGLVGVILLGRIHPAGPALIIARDLVIMAGFALLLRRGVEMRVDFAGKVSSALAMAGAGGAILLDALWVDVLFWAAVAMSLGTLAHYAVIAARRLRAARGAPAEAPSTRP
ncbi:CDP-alcohol phosphatidyltransferase family protein [Miltoncostaea marina]|uniref:CDP-alcohol phosphatidyltransferase family protein n=1 Tax=Miltoncostaea marina TaxID=2843215 RepID=UPI001C3D902D|nr:CDP-alcohol phosphatidyltransferase family protein [Miltoncostaea marina]